MGVLILIIFIFYKWLNVMTLDEELTEQLVFSGKDFLFSAGAYADTSLFMAIIIGIFIGGEFSTGITRSMVARGTDRVQLYFSKLISVWILTVVYTAFAFIFCGILAAIIGYGYKFTGHEFALILRAYALQTLALMSISSIFVFLSFLVRSQGAAIGVSIAVYILVNMLLSVIVAIASMIGEDAAWVVEAAKYIPSQQLEAATSYGAYEIGDLMRLIFVPIGYIVVSSGIGVLTTVKRDVK